MNHTMSTGPPDDFLLAVCDYETLEQADRQTGGQHGEEWLINLQNHLIWRSFVPDAESAPVVRLALMQAAARFRLAPSELPSWAIALF